MDPPAGLADFVFARIEKEKIKRAKRQLVFSYFGLGGSFALATFVVAVFGQAFWQSEFWTMLSLIFSDISIVAGNLDTYALSLLETFPATHMAIFLIPIFMMLFSAGFCFSGKVNCKREFNLITS